MNKEKEFLGWLDQVQTKLDLTDNEAGQAVIYEVKSKFMEVFKNSLKHRSVHEVIQECLESENLKIGDLKNPSKYMTARKHKAIRAIHKSMPYEMSYTSLADVLGVTPQLVSMAITRKKRKKKVKLFQW